MSMFSSVVADYKSIKGWKPSEYPHMKGAKGWVMFPLIEKENHREGNSERIAVSVHMYSWPTTRYHAVF